MANIETFQCVQCGEDFPAVRRADRENLYCSRKCFYDSRMGRERPEVRVEPDEKVCESCGETFLVGGAGRPPRGQRFCSTRCQSASRFRRGRECAVLEPLIAAYLAGLIDGEGYIGVPPRGASFHLRVSVTNTDRPVMEWLAEVTKIGTVAHTRSKNARHKDRFTWNVNGDAAQSLLRQLLPCLRVKRERAEIAVEFHERLRDPALKADRSWQVEVAERMKVLNARGPVTAAPERLR